MFAVLPPDAFSGFLLSSEVLEAASSWMCDELISKESLGPGPAVSLMNFWTDFWKNPLICLHFGFLIC